MADGRIVVKAEVDAKNAQKELDKLTAKIDKMEADLKKAPVSRVAWNLSLTQRKNLQNRQKMR